MGETVHQDRLKKCAIFVVLNNGLKSKCANVLIEVTCGGHFEPSEYVRSGDLRENAVIELCSRQVFCSGPFGACVDRESCPLRIVLRCFELIKRRRWWATSSPVGQSVTVFTKREAVLRMGWCLSSPSTSVHRGSLKGAKSSSSGIYPRYLARMNYSFLVTHDR